MKVKTVWLLETHDTDAYYNKVNVKHIGLFNTKDAAKDYVILILGKSEEYFVWCCSVTKLENIVDCTN